MLRPCNLNPRLSAFESMEGMYSFDATPMAPVGTKKLIHLKPVRCHTWGYHALKAWYIGMSLKHYRVIKTVTESGAMQLSDTFKFKHNVLTTPTVTPIDRIVKVMRDLATIIQFRGDKPPDELGAIEHLRALITGNSVAPPNQYIEAAEQANNSIIADPPPQEQEPYPEPAPQPVSITVPVNNCDFPVFATDCTPAADDGRRPELLSKEDDDEKIMRPRYNLQPRPNLFNATIDPTIIPGVNIKSLERKYSHSLTAENHASQLWQHQSTMNANPPHENFSGSILDDKTGKPL